MSLPTIKRNDLKSIGELCKIVDCEHKTAPYVEESDYLVVRTSNVKSGSLWFEDIKYTTLEGYKAWTSRGVPTPGDILFTREAPAGEACLVPIDLNVCMGQRMVLLRCDEAVIESRYLLYCFLAEEGRHQIYRYSIGSTVTRINIEDIARLSVELPTLPEQRKIADFLTAVDGRIGQLIQKRALLEDYKKGVMQQLFTQAIRFQDDHGNDFPDWEEKKLGEIVEVNPRNTELPESFIYIDLESVNDGQLHSPRRIAKADAPSRAQRLLRKGDILYQTVRPYQMNNYRFDLDDVHVASTGYAQLRASSHNAEFVYQSVHFPAFVGAVLDRCTGTSYPAINSKDLAQIKLGVPSLPEQTKIANFLSAIDRKIETVATQITETQTFKRGLLQQMFV